MQTEQVDPALAEWLLAAQTPSIRYLTLRKLIGLDESNAMVQATRRTLASEGPVPAILAAQTAQGHWLDERSFYTPKYTATHWTLTLLCELAADPADSGARRGVEYMLARSGAVPAATAATSRPHFPCFWGNLLRYALYFGFADDPRVAVIIRTLTANAHDEAFACLQNGMLPCAWGAARLLWGLAALPAERRTAEVNDAIERGTALLLERSALLTGSYPTSGQVHIYWSRLNFPLFYQGDILFVLRVIADLGALDHPGARRALEWLHERRGTNGRWRGASPYRRQTWDLGGAEETSRWLSLHAAAVLAQSPLR